MANDRFIIINTAELAPEDAVEIPNKLITDSRISPGAVRLYVTIAIADDESLPDKWYAEKMDISMATLYKYKKELREAGYIE